MPKIRNLELPSRVLLAPMLEPNDIAFRLLCKKAGAGLTYTGMTNPLTKKRIHFDDVPALQLFNSTTDGFKEFVKENDSKVSLWDFNLGCPSKMSKKLAHGSFMHKDFRTIKRILEIIRENSDKPITIKLRKSPQAIDLAKHVEENVDAIAIHPRTSEEGYSGKADYNFALKLRDTVKVPIIYSGDVNKENIGKILEDFPFVFVGRAAVGNPSIFSEIEGKKIEINFKDYLEIAEKYDIPFKNLKLHAMYFTKGKDNAKEMRGSLIKAKTVEDLRKIVK